MDKTSMDKNMVKRINEIYHDIESKTYIKRHPEIYSEESLVWEKLGEKYFKSNKQVTVLDIGTGPGFVPSVIGKYLKKGDVLISSDISDLMLKQAEKQLTIYKHFNKKFIKGDALEISKMVPKVNIITMNSVLHHLPDYEDVLPCLENLVDENGYFIIMHECNSRAFTHRPFLMKLYLALQQLKHLTMRFIKKLLIIFKLYKKFDFGRAKMQLETEILYSKIQKAIKNQEIVRRELTVNEINEIIDFHDLEEGGEGFDPFVIHNKYFSNYEIVDLFMTKHLGLWVDETSDIFNNLFSNLIKRYYPYSGAIFGIVMKKNTSKSGACR